MSKIEVIGLGALNIDHIYKVEHILEDGEAVVDEAGLFPGGSAANTIYGLAKLGISTGFVGAVGDDVEGRLMRQDFDKAGVDTSRIKIKRGAKTGQVLCLSDKTGKRSLYVVPGANNLLTPDDLDLAYIKQANLIHLSSFADDRQFQVLLKLTNKLEPSVKVSFSPGELYAAKGLKALAPILSRTDVLFINESEMRKLTSADFTVGAETCLEQGCSTVVVTLGGGPELELQGEVASQERVSAVSYIRDAENSYVIKSKSQNVAPVVDTTGAGDAFTAGFLYGLLKGKTLEQCGLLGDIVARFSITKWGTRQGLPTATELAQRYRKLYNQQL